MCLISSYGIIFLKINIKSESNINWLPLHFVINEIPSSYDQLKKKEKSLDNNHNKKNLFFKGGGTRQLDF